MTPETSIIEDQRTENKDDDKYVDGDGNTQKTSRVNTRKIIIRVGGDGGPTGDQQRQTTSADEHRQRRDKRRNAQLRNGPTIETTNQTANQHNRSDGGKQPVGTDPSRYDSGQGRQRADRDINASCHDDKS